MRLLRYLASQLLPTLGVTSQFWGGAALARCGCGVCEYFRDMFDRADDTDLGIDWDEEEGDWEIVGDELNTSDTGAFVACLREVPNFGAAFSGDQHLSVVVVDAPVGSIVKLIVAYSRLTFDRQAWIAVEFHIGDPLKVQFKRRNSNGTESDLSFGWFPGVGTSFNASLCMSDEALRADIGPHSLTSFGPAPAGPLAALGTGTNVGTVIFDDFVLRKTLPLEDGTECEPCEAIATCDTECGDGNDGLPDEFQIELDGITERVGGGCADCALELNGTFVAPHDLLVGNSKCNWRHTYAEEWCDHPISACRGYSHIRVGIGRSGPNSEFVKITVQIRHGGLPSIDFFYEAPYSVIDCAGINGLVIPWLSDTFCGGSNRVCTGEFATCTLTAL